MTVSLLMPTIWKKLVVSLIMANQEAGVRDKHTLRRSSSASLGIVIGAMTVAGSWRDSSDSGSTGGSPSKVSPPSKILLDKSPILAGRFFLGRLILSSTVLAHRESLFGSPLTESRTRRVQRCDGTHSGGQKIEIACFEREININWQMR